MNRYASSLLAVALSGALFSSPAAAQPSEPAGKWNTPWGEMNLLRDGDQVTGSYNYHGGRISGRYADDLLNGYWFQNTSEQRCSRAISGSRFWGQVRLRFDGDRFDGTWSYCGEPPSRSGWSGSRVVAAPATPARTEQDPTAMVLGALAKELPPEVSELLGLDEAAQSAKSATPSPAVTQEMAYGVLDPQWRATLRNGRPKTLQGDLTCDGGADYFVGWTDLDNPDRQVYHLAVVHHDGDRLTHHHVELPLGGDDQHALCVMGPNTFPDVTLSTYAYNDTDRSTFGLPASCLGAVRLDDGMCGAIFIGWNPAEKKFILHRN